MPPAMNAGDRKVLIIAGAAFLLLMVIGFLLAPNNQDVERATTYSTASGGAKAAYLLLNESGYNVARWEKPASLLKAEGRTVLIIADALAAPDQKEKSAIEQFISEGGTVIATGIVGAAFLPEDDSETDAMPGVPQSTFAALTPSAITRAAPTITLAPVAHWSRSSAIPLYGDQGKTVVTRLVLGRGSGIWLASATPLTNSGLKEKNNLEFLLAAIGDRGTTRVLFDEYVHGYGDQGTPERSHPLLIALLLQSAVLAAVALFSFSRRSGPLRPLPVESRLSPLEFVETLGGLYEQANAAAIAVDVYYQRFHFWITRRLGLGKEASPEEINRAVRERWRWEDDKFLSTLQNAASSRYYPGLPEKHALEIVQALYAYAAKLKLFAMGKEMN